MNSSEENILAFVEQLAAQERLYAAIGKVASNWAVFEHLLNSSLWVLAKVDDQPGACLTSQIPNIARSLDAFSALVRLRGGDEAVMARINKFIEKTHGLGPRRNRVVHDPWNWEAGKPQRFQASAQKKLILGMQPMETSEVEQLVDEIYEHIVAFEKIIEEISAKLAASAGISFERLAKAPEVPSVDK